MKNSPVTITEPAVVAAKEVKRLRRGPLQAVPYLAEESGRRITGQCVQFPPNILKSWHLTFSR